MVRAFLTVGPVLILLASPAQAQGVPDVLLEESYKKCLDGETPSSDPQRAAYCECVAEDMRNWDINSFISAIRENPQDPSSKLNQVARACMQKIMK